MNSIPATPLPFRYIYICTHTHTHTQTQVRPSGECLTNYVALLKVQFGQPCFNEFNTLPLSFSLRYKPEDRGFDSRWCHGFFH